MSSEAHTDRQLASPQHASHTDGGYKHHELPTSGRELTNVAVSATLHCLTGCALGEIAGMAIGTALGSGYRHPAHASRLAAHTTVRHNRRPHEPSETIACCLHENQ